MYMLGNQGKKCEMICKLPGGKRIHNASEEKVKCEEEPFFPRQGRWAAHHGASSCPDAQITVARA